MLANIIKNAKKTVGGGGGGIVIGGDPYYSAVSLLLSMDGTNGSTTFTDSGPNAIAVTNVGSPTTSTTQLKFGTSAAAVGGTNYLTLPNNSSLFDFGLGDFTIEFWFYYSSSQSGQIQVAVRSANQSGSLSPWLLNKKSGTNYMAFSWTSDGASWVLNEKVGTVAMTPNAWNHVAIVRRSGIFYSYINGTQDWSDSTSSTSAIQAGGDVLAIGRWPKYANSPGTYYIDDFRISQFARYTSTFSPPTAALPTTASSTPVDPYYGYTSLLLHMDGTNASTNFVDSGPSALTVTRTGTPAISTSQSKYGGASVAFSGTTDRLDVASNALFAFGTGDFTVEFWLYFNSVSTAQTSFVNVNVAGGFSCYWTASAYYSVPVNNFVVSNRSVGQFQSTWIPSANTWYHIAISRSGTNLRVFIDGAQLGSTVTSSTSYIQGPLQIGGSTDGAGWTVNGNIDDLRITKYARYQSSFTPPTQAHPNIYNPYTTLPVSGAALWLDASQQNTIFTDAGTTPVTTSGQSIYQWNDLSGNNRHAVQATSGSRPTWVPPASGQNGLGVVGFNGSQWLGFTSTLSSFTIFVVYKNTDTTNGSALIGKSSGTSNYLSASTVSRIEMNAGSAQQANSSRTNGTQWDYSTFKYDGSVVTAYSSGSTGTSNTVGTTSFTPDRIGYYATSIYALEGSIAEIVVYPTALSDPNRTSVVNYIKAKWNL